MKVIISGATGFVGEKLVKYMLESGDHVVVIVRDKGKLDQSIINKVNVIEAELSDYTQLDIKEDDYDVFFHLAWSGTSGPERGNYLTQIDNIRYSCDAVSLAKRIGCKRFVYAGSIMEYECLSDFMQNSVPPINNCYSVSKYTADFMTQAIANNIGIEYVGIVISNIYGEGEESKRFINTTIKKMIKGESIELSSCEQLYDFIYISDAVRAIYLVAKAGMNNQRYYIGSIEQIPLKQYVIQMKEVCNSNSELLFGKIKSSSKGLDYSVIDSKKIYELGFKSEVSFAEGIKRIGEWYSGKGF